MNSFSLENSKINDNRTIEAIEELHIENILSQSIEVRTKVLFGIRESTGKKVGGIVGFK